MPLPISTLSPDTTLALLQAGQTTPVAASAKNTAALEDGAQDFEAMFLSEMLKPVFESLPVDEAFGGGKGEEVFRRMMVEEYGKIMARAGGIGLSDNVREELIRMQGEATGSQIAAKENAE